MPKSPDQMHCEGGSSSAFCCSTASWNVEYPSEAPATIRNLRNALSFVFDSLDKGEQRWQELRTSWDIENVRITVVDYEAGLLPAAYRVIVTFHSNHKPYSVILKVRSYSVFCREDGEEGSRLLKPKQMKPFVELHEREINFYKDIATWATIPVPTAYFTQSWDIPANRDGLFVMEDLIREGVRQNVYTGFTVDQVKSIVRHLAQFHASTLWSENVDDVLSKFQPLLGRSTDGDSDSLVERLAQLPDSDYFKANSDALKHFLSTGYDSDAALADENVRTVLCHGNLWTANVMFKKSWLGSACSEVRAIINWQYCHEGSPLEDLARVIVSSTSSQIRHENCDHFLDYYFDQLCQNMNKKNLKIPFSLQKVHDLYRSQFSRQVRFLFGSHLPFLLLPTFADRATEEHKKLLRDRMQDAFEDVRSH